MSRYLKIYILLVGAFMLSFVNSQAVASSNDNKELNVREFILEHVSARAPT